VPGVIRVMLQPILMNMRHIDFTPSITLATLDERLKLYSWICDGIHAHDSDYFWSSFTSDDHYDEYSTYVYQSTGIRSPSTYIANQTFTPTTLRFVDAGANICMAPPRSAFTLGTYTRPRYPINVKGIDVDVHENGLVKLNLAHIDDHTRKPKIEAAHAPLMTRCSGATSILSQEPLRKEHNINFYYLLNRQPLASDHHGTFILVLHISLTHLYIIPSELTYLIAHKGDGPTYTKKRKTTRAAWSLLHVSCRASTISNVSVLYNEVGMAARTRAVASG
jgi:hypothetical protein